MRIRPVEHETCEKKQHPNEGFSIVEYRFLFGNLRIPSKKDEGISA